MMSCLGEWLAIWRAILMELDHPSTGREAFSVKAITRTGTVSIGVLMQFVSFSQFIAALS